MSDDRYHEIQLGGKQLVFLFMAAAVVAVVVFLAGVMVGRGVRTEKGGLADADTAGAAVEAGGADGAAAFAPGAGAGAPGQAGAGGGSARQAAQQAAPDELSYYSQLEGQTQPAAGATPPRAEPTTAEPVASEVPSEPPPQPPAAASAAASAPSSEAEPAGSFSLQVAALRDRAAASAVLKRLVAKKYDAYIVDPPKGSSPLVFRVRVGHFKTRREAEAVMRRLEKDQYKPLITR